MNNRTAQMTAIWEEIPSFNNRLRNNYLVIENEINTWASNRAADYTEGKISKVEIKVAATKAQERFTARLHAATDKRIDEKVISAAVLEEMRARFQTHRK